MQIDDALDFILLEQGGKFNNKLIMSVVKNELLRKAFLAFSESEGKGLIDSSRINDKESHVKALEIYRKMCLDHREFRRVPQTGELKEEPFE